MDRAKEKRLARERRHARVRKRVTGTPERPRLCVFRSLQHIYAQIIDDTQGHTLVSAATVDAECRRLGAEVLPDRESTGTAGVTPEGAQVTGKIEQAKIVGQLLAQRAAAAGIRQVVFDRGGYPYHGRVKALAEGAREGGLEF